MAFLSAMQQMLHVKWWENTVTCVYTSSWYQCTWPGGTDGVSPQSTYWEHQSHVCFQRCTERSLLWQWYMIHLLTIIVILTNTRNSSGDEIANVNFRNDDIIHAVQNTIDSCINSAIDRSLQRRFTRFCEITQCKGHYTVQCHLRSPILVPIERSYTTSC